MIEQENAMADIMNDRQREEEEKKKIEEEKARVEKEQEEHAQKIRFDMEKQQIELEMVKKQMEQEQERNNKAIQDMKKQYENKIKNENQFEQIRQRMKDIRKDVAEANEIAKFMNKDVTFTDTYISKFDEEGVYGSGGKSFNMDEMQDEVQVKVENFDTGQINVWSCDKFQDKLMMMRDALQTYEDREFQELDPSEDPFYEKQEPILLG